jgi:hypothetical protein
MNLELASVAERLAQEFSDLPSRVVIDAVCGCAGECAAAGPYFIEQAARARLCAQTPPPVLPVLPVQPGAADVADAF